MQKLLLILLSFITIPVLAQQAALNDIRKDIAYSPRPSAHNGINPVLSLNGTWRFNPDGETRMEAIQPLDGSRWNTINVPGDWTNHGYKVTPGKPGLYFRTFTIPETWKGKRIRLRTDGVQSWCRIWVNSKYAGAHLGGFTANELDITDLIKTGVNRIFIAVQNESIADSLASTTQYAAFQIGGIFRKIYLIALPQINFSDLKVEAGMKPGNKTGRLRLRYTVHNQGNNLPDDVKVSCKLYNRNGIEIKSEIHENTLQLLRPGTKAEVIADTEIAGVEKWECEHPVRYKLVIQLNVDGQLTETVEQWIGFRTIQVVGNQVFVNGMPVKLHGSNRHETHPVTGRSVTPGLCLQDALLFRNANHNYIRTSHYPPSEEFLDACDSLGMFVEVESPFCWVGHAANAKWENENPQSQSFVDYIMQATAENVSFNFNHPSILMWSLANESMWSDIWKRAHEVAMKIDNTRPMTFHDQAFGGYNNAGSTEMPVANYHYPGDDDPFNRRNNDRPLLYGEYCHVNTYNRREILTDPGVRDNWGEGFSRMWERCYLSKAILGGAIWSGIDDIFYLPDSTAVGYGEWGIIDGWRRTKPEYFHVKKAYSPVRVFNQELRLPGTDGIIRLNVENRHDFTDFSELKISWKAGLHAGITAMNLAPRAEGILEIETGVLTGEEDFLEIWFTSPRGFEIDRYKIPFSKRPANPVSPPGRVNSPLTLQQIGGLILAEGNGIKYSFDNESGQLVAVYENGQAVISMPPVLMLLPQATEECRPQHNLFIKPFNDTWSGWKCVEFNCKLNGDTLIASTRGSYAEGEGVILLKITPDGRINCSYDFAVNKDVNPRQYGMVFYLPEEFNVLKWKRKGIWAGYPDDHIGREEGTATAELQIRRTSLRAMPDNEWKDDLRLLGNNDFCSTKSNILLASLTSENGKGIEVQSDGRHSIRAFRENGRSGLLIADFNSGGGDLFFAGHHQAEDRPLKTSDRMKGSFSVRILHQSE